MRAHPTLFASPSPLPMMMYSAMSLRPHVPAKPGSFVFLSVGYFNVMLPATLSSSSSSSSSEEFWSRAKEVKNQLNEYLGNPKLISRSLEMSKERANRAKRFAREDDEVLAKRDTPYYVPQVRESAKEEAARMLAAKKDTPYYAPWAKDSWKKEDLADAVKDTPYYVPRETSPSKVDEEALASAAKDTPYYVPRHKDPSERDPEALAGAARETPYHVPREQDSKEDQALALQHTPYYVSKAQTSTKQLGEEAFAAEKDTPYYVPRFPATTSSPPKPSIAFLGLSQVQNVDRLYTDSLYPSLSLLSITAGTRKAKGGMLMFSRTFKGRLHLSLGWDKNGFKEGYVEEFWERVKSGVEEFLVKGRESAIVSRL